MNDAEANESRLCPAAILPLVEAADANGGFAKTEADVFCSCDAGPQRRNLLVGNVELPIKDPRPGKFVCGKALEVLS